MKKPLIYVIGAGNYCHGYSNWLNIGGYTSIEMADFCLGLGGSDVSSKYYNQPKSSYLFSDEITDRIEYEDYQRAIELKKPIIGICKGSQWLSALAGGAIFQHINHPYFHKISTYDGLKLTVNSLHHNLADLSNLKENIDYKLLAWAENLSPFHINGYNQNIECKKEPEVVYFPKINGLGLQNHNEMLYADDECSQMIDWSRNIVNKFLSGQL